ncbi:hypothetical protein F4823DRAFT_619795 [Ustulina deusta]|nr:hypothetical protein F4823DRAFT_619795 [Ustulina deusta]
MATSKNFGAAWPHGNIMLFSVIQFSSARASTDNLGMFMDSLEDKSELLIHEPSDFIRSSNLATPAVYTGFSPLLHVNLEARSIAQKRASFAYCHRAQCMVPVRPFRPELDVLYIPWEAWRSFFLLREFHYGDVWLPQLQHVAVDICLSTNLAAFFRHAQHIPSVRTLRFVTSYDWVLVI